MGVHHAAVFVILPLGHRCSSDLLGRVGPEPSHQVGHLPQAIQAGHHQVQGLLPIVAILLVQLQQGVVQGHTLTGIPGSHLGQAHRGGHRVLVPDIVPQHIAVGLLVGKDHLALSRPLQLVLLLRQELKAGEGVVALKAVDLGHLPGHLGSDDGLQGHGFFRHLPGAVLGPNEVVQQQHTGLVAGEHPILPIARADHDAHPVGVRVGTQDEVCPVLLS